MFGINSAIPLSWWHKGRGLCAYAHPMSTKIQTCWHDKRIQRTSPLPADLSALVPNEALQGMTQGTLQDWVLPLSHASIRYGSKRPRVYAQVTAHLEWTGRSYVTAHNFNSISKNQSKAISHRSLLSCTEQPGVIIWLSIILIFIRV